MSFSHPTPWLSDVLDRFAAWLDRRTALRLPLLLLGALLASGRRTATSWFRAAGITDEFRPAYHTIYAAGRRTEDLALTAWLTACPCLTRSRRLLLAIDDTPTPRYGPCVEGAGIHHNPTPGPAGEKFVYGHLWVLLAGLAKRAGHKRGWKQVECEQYGQRVTKTYKTFLATWRPAGGLIRVVLVQEEHSWVPFFCTDPEASVVDILEAAADRGAVEQTNKDLKEVWGAGQQQLRNVYANVGAFNCNGWLHTMVEAWAWERPEEELVDRSASPWDDASRRPSHADKRKALQREVLRQEIEAVLAGPPDRQRFRELAEKLLDLAA